MRRSRLPTPGECTSIAEEVVTGPHLRDRRGGLAHAETDFEHARRAAAERTVEVERVAANGMP